jgi:hypothetical protein
MVLELADDLDYRVYIFSRGYFYTKHWMEGGKLEFIDINRGHHGMVQLAFQQFQKLPLDEFYRKTVPEGTPDCNADSDYNLDTVSL